MVECRFEEPNIHVQFMIIAKSLNCNGHRLVCNTNEIFQS